MSLGLVSLVKPWHVGLREDRQGVRLPHGRMTALCCRQTNALSHPADVFTPIRPVTMSFEIRDFPAGIKVADLQERLYWVISMGSAACSPWKVKDTPRGVKEMQQFLTHCCWPWRRRKGVWAKWQWSLSTRNDCHPTSPWKQGLWLQHQVDSAKPSKSTKFFLESLRRNCPLSVLHLKL